MKKIILKQDNHATHPYRIVQIEGSVEFRIGERFSKEEVTELLLIWSVVIK